MYFFYTADGIKLHAWWIPNPNNSNSYPLLYCHGSGANLAFQYRIDRYTNLFNMGYSIFTFDYPGYGRSEGTPSEKGVYDATDAAFSHLVYNMNLTISPSNVTVLGRSLGSSAASKMLGRYTVKAAIILSGFAKFSDCIQYAYPMFGWYITAISGVEFDNLDDISKYSRPLFQYHSKDDETVPISSAKKLFDSNQVPTALKVFTELSGFKHDDPQSQEELNQLKSFTENFVMKM